MKPGTRIGVCVLMFQIARRSICVCTFLTVTASHPSDADAPPLPNFRGFSSHPTFSSSPPAPLSILEYGVRRHPFISQSWLNDPPFSLHLALFSLLL